MGFYIRYNHLSNMYASNEDYKKYQRNQARKELGECCCGMLIMCTLISLVVSFVVMITPLTGMCYIVEEPEFKEELSSGSTVYMIYFNAYFNQDCEDTFDTENIEEFQYRSTNKIIIDNLYDEIYSNYNTSASFACKKHKQSHNEIYIRENTEFVC